MWYIHIIAPICFSMGPRSTLGLYSCFTRYWEVKDIQIFIHPLSKTKIEDNLDVLEIIDKMVIIQNLSCWVMVINKICLI